MLYEVVAYEGGNPLALGIVVVILLLVFILPIVSMLRATRRRA